VENISMEWVETTGRTITEALDAALDELGVDEEDVEYEVLEEPKSGFLGRLGSSEGRIRARVKPISREKPGERQRRNRRGAPKARGASSTSAGAGNGAGGAGGGGSSGAGSASARPGGGSSSSNRRRRGGNGRSRTQSGGERQEQQGSSVDTIENDVPIEEQAAAAERFTQGLVDAFDLGGQVKSIIDDDVVLVDVTGDGLGLLVGPKGATLHAIEELVRTVVQRQTDGHGVRIHVDVAGYRAKRRAALADFTRDLAEKVAETGRPQALEPMSASDRKVVHDTAAEIDGITTVSEGEDPRRRVILRPA